MGNYFKKITIFLKYCTQVQLREKVSLFNQTVHSFEEWLLEMSVYLDQIFISVDHHIHEGQIQQVLGSVRDTGWFPA